MTIETPEPAVTPQPSMPAAKRFSRPLIVVAAAALVALGTFGGVVAYAKAKGGPMGEKRIERLLEKVNATEEQKTKIKAIMDTARTDMEKLRDDTRTAVKETTALLSAETIDRAAIEAKRAERFAKMEQASKRMTAAMVDVADVLKPDQRKQVAEFLTRQMEHRGGKNRDGNRERKMDDGNKDGGESNN